MMKKIFGFIATNTYTEEQLPICESLYKCIKMINDKGTCDLSELINSDLAEEEADKVKTGIFSPWEIACASAVIDAPEDKDWSACSMEATTLNAWMPEPGAFIFGFSTAWFSKFHPFG